MQFNFKHNYGIYRLIFPNGKSYIGQSVDLNNRFSLYKNSLCKKQNHLYNAIQKYGWDNIKIEILLYTDDRRILNIAEVFFIKYFHSMKNGYNMTVGGGGCNGAKRSEETKRKMSIAGKGRIVSKESKEKMSKAQKGKKHKERSKEWREAHTIRCIGKKSNIKSSSKYCGVYWNKIENKWRAHIGFKKYKIIIGRFLLETEAALAYNKKAKELYGDNAKLNIITQEDIDKDKIIDLSIDKRIGKNKPIINSSGYYGVSFSNDKNKWVCRITVNNKRKYLGSFRTELEAAIAYNSYIILNNLPYKTNIIPQTEQDTINEVCTRTN